LSESTPSVSAQTLSPHHLRLFALLIDYLLIVVLLNLGQQALLGADWDLRPPPDGLWADVWPRLLAAGTMFLIRDALLGASPGKWLMGITVGRADAPMASPARGALLLRNLTLPLLPLEALWVFVDPFGRRLGDKLAGTVVVSVPRAAAIGRRMLAFTAFLLAALLAGLLAAPWNMRRSAAYREAERVIAQDPKVARAAGLGASLAEPPQFDLELASDPARARIRFSVQGSLGTVEGELVLRMEVRPRRWVRQSLTLREPSLMPTDAPPAPAGMAR